MKSTAGYKAEKQRTFFQRYIEPKLGQLVTMEEISHGMNKLGYITEPKIFMHYVRKHYPDYIFASVKGLDRQGGYVVIKRPRTPG